MDRKPLSGLAVPRHPTPHTNTPPLKPPKKYRGEDEDTEILRCKRRLDFAARLGLPGMHRPHPETVAKRNERERKRVKQINTTFNTLKSRLPSGLFKEKSEKKRSKVDTLRAAIEYIRNMEDLLEEHDAVTSLSGLVAPQASPAPRVPAPHSSYTPASAVSPGSTYSSAGSEGSPTGPAARPAAPPPPGHHGRAPQPTGPLSPDDQDLINFATGWF